MEKIIWYSGAGTREFPSQMRHFPSPSSFFLHVGSLYFVELWSMIYINPAAEGIRSLGWTLCSSPGELEKHLGFSTPLHTKFSERGIGITIFASLVDVYTFGPQISGRMCYMAGVPNLQPWTGTSHQISSSIQLELKYIINVMCLNHPQTIPPIPFLVHGKMFFHETGSWCQKGWRLLLYGNHKRRKIRGFLAGLGSLGAPSSKTVLYSRCEFQ